MKMDTKMSLHYSREFQLIFVQNRIAGFSNLDIRISDIKQDQCGSEYMKFIKIHIHESSSAKRKH